MNTLTTINSPVVVTAIGFDRAMHAYPKRMEWQGQTYCFIDRGIHIRRGETHSGAMTMSDGQRNFCLKKIPDGWLLVGIS